MRLVHARHTERRTEPQAQSSSRHRCSGGVLNRKTQQGKPSAAREQQAAKCHWSIVAHALAECQAARTRLDCRPLRPLRPRLAAARMRLQRARDVQNRSGRRAKAAHGPSRSVVEP